MFGRTLAFCECGRNGVKDFAVKLKRSECVPWMLKTANMAHNCVDTLQVLGGWFTTATINSLDACRMIFVFFPTVTELTLESIWTTEFVPWNNRMKRPIRAFEGKLGGEVWSFEILPVVCIDTGKRIVSVPCKRAVLRLKIKKQKLHADKK